VGYTLDFFSLDWKRLREALGSGDRTLFDEVRQGAGAVPFASAARHGYDCQKALESLIMGQRGRVMRTRGVDTVGEESQAATPDLAVAFTALLETLGQTVGQLIHNSAAGPAFRDQFLPRAQNALKCPLDLNFLIERPLFGIVHEDYPAWGGLRRSEVVEVLGKQALDELPEMDDTDEDEWLYELVEALRYSRQSGVDLVTLYR
jgi:hypothetical protein